MEFKHYITKVNAHEISCAIHLPTTHVNMSK